LYPKKNQSVAEMVDYFINGGFSVNRSDFSPLEREVR
jgi:hypothetical protein